MVTLATHGPYGQVPRADVAAVGLGVLDRPATDRVLEVVSGTEAVEAALDAATRTAD
jgi:acetylornithine/succinyldiaminopimelate/putrescine aminotransferase